MCSCLQCFCINSVDNVSVKRLHMVKCVCLCVLLTTRSDDTSALSNGLLAALFSPSWLAFYPTTSERKSVLFVASFIQQTSCFCWTSATCSSQGDVPETSGVQSDHITGWNECLGNLKTDARTAHFLYKCKSLCLWIIPFSLCVLVCFCVCVVSLPNASEQREGVCG